MSTVEMELYQTAALTFEDLAFTFLTPEMLDATLEVEPEASAFVEFKGPISGRMVISVYGCVLTEIAANMLGQSEIPTDEEQLDALGEMANIICGNVLPKITNKTDIFNIDAPKASNGASVWADASGSPAAHVTLPLADGRADLMLYIN